MLDINNAIISHNCPLSTIYDFNSIIIDKDGTRIYNKEPIHITILEYFISDETTLETVKTLDNMPYNKFIKLVIEQQHIPLIIGIKDPSIYKGLAVVETAEDLEHLKKFYKTLDIIV